MRKTLLLFTTMALVLLLAAGMAWAALPAPTVVRTVPPSPVTTPPTPPPPPAGPHPPTPDTSPHRRGPQRQHHGDVLRGDEHEEPRDLQPLHLHFLVQDLLPPARQLHRPESN